MGIFRKLFARTSRAEDHHRESNSMDANPEINMIVFEYGTGDNADHLMGRGPTRAEDCLQGVWRAIESQAVIEPHSVTRIYSEWQLSDSDAEFATKTFPNAEFSASFSRPENPDDWRVALDAARRTMLKASTRNER